MKRWSTIARQVLRLPAHVEVVVRPHEAVHPQKAGFRLHVGSDQGQLADWRAYAGRPPHDKRGLHVRDYGTHWTIHWDHVDPRLDPVAHARQDAPRYLVAGGGAAGALAGWWLGGLRGAVLGALVGSLATLALTAPRGPSSSAPKRERPQTPGTRLEPMNRSLTSALSTPSVRTSRCESYPSSSPSPATKSA